MFRFIGYLLLIVLVLLGVAGIFGYLSYGLRPEVGGTIQVADIATTATVEWDGDGMTIIKAESEKDAYLALGYAHAAQNGWQMMLMRQTATGGLTQWYNEAVRDLDTFIHELGIPEQAQSAYRKLAPEERQAVDAYTKGVNLIFERSKSKLPDEMLLSGREVAAWQGWETLAVERLLAWVGTQPLILPDSLTANERQVFQKFQNNDGQLRKWLHLHGFENGMAWTVKQGNQSYFFQRHVTGSSALPLFQEVKLRLGGKETQVLTLPGTLNFPTGKNEGLAWHVFMTAPLTLNRVAFADSTFKRRFSVLKDKNQDEKLITTWHLGNDLALRIPKAKGDSLEKSSFLLGWTGFSNKSDIRTFRRLLNGFTPDSSAFSLLKGNGLVLSRSGGQQVLGNPKVLETLENGTLVSDSRWGRETAKVLRRLSNQSLSYALSNKSAFSEWAIQKSGMIKALDTLKVKPNELWQPLKYLRNWDYRFDDAAIGASIFDRWMATYQRQQAQLPDSLRNLQPIDSLSRVRVLKGYEKSLLATIHDMKQQPELGSDFRKWRWENAQPLYAYYPVWSSPLSGFAGSNLHQNRYAPVRLFGNGHPSSLFWRPSWTETRPSSMAWEGWFSNQDWKTWHLHRAKVNFEGFIGRYRVLNPLQSFAWGDGSTIVKAQAVLVKG